MQSNITENIVLYDWFSFTSKKHTPEELIKALGLEALPWIETTGAHGYMDRLYFGSISIHYNGREDMGVWVEMSGQGCRNFETYTTLPNKWGSLISFVLGNKLHITRVDVAYDDHTGILDIDRIANDTVNQLFVSRLTCWQSIRSSSGTSVVIGSPKSKTLIRIYDKAAERGFEEMHWIRVELQLRDSRAENFIKLMLPIGEAFAGVLLNYLRFVEPDETDSNKSRWTMADYWEALVGDVGRISIFTMPGAEYNLEKCKDYVMNQAGNAIAALIECCESPDDFFTLINGRSCKPNPKYDYMVKEHHAKLEAWAKHVESLLEDDINIPLFQSV